MTPTIEATLFAAARWLAYLASFLLIGAAVVRQVILPRVLSPDEGEAAATRIARLGIGAGLVLLLAHAGRLYWQARSLLDPGEPLTSEFLELVLDGTWGRGWTLQAGAAVLATVGWTVAGFRPGSRSWAAPAGAGGLFVAIAAPFTGHAVGLPQAGWMGPALDALHLAAGGAWLGSLAVLLVVGLRSGAPVPRSSIPDLVAAFSPVALVSGLLAILAGVIIGYRYLGGLAPLWTSGYGRALAAKLLVLAGVAAAGAFNWRVVLPQLRRDGDPTRVRGTARLELALGALLLAITAVLVALPAPGEE